MKKPEVLQDGSFDEANIERIYRGEPAQIGGLNAAEILTPNVYDVAAQVAQDVSYKTLAERRSRSLFTIRTQMHEAYTRLGILGRPQLVPFFPLEGDNELLEGKRLTDHSYTELDILQALSVGACCKEVATERDITESTVRTHIHNLIGKWEGVASQVGALRVANGIRAQYVNRVEEATGRISPGDLGSLTLPAVADLELMADKAEQPVHTLDTYGLSLI